MKIKVELTKPQYLLLMDALGDHFMSLDAMHGSGNSQTKDMKMLERIIQKLIEARFHSHPQWPINTKSEKVCNDPS